MFKFIFTIALVGCTAHVWSPSPTNDAGPPTFSEAGPPAVDPFGLCVFGGGFELPCLGPTGEAQWIYASGINCTQEGVTEQDLVCYGLVSPVQGKEGSTIQ